MATGRARPATVFFADILGFSAMASTPGAQPAAGALADMARLFRADKLGRHLRGTWARRYGLSDSLLLVAKDPRTAAAEAAGFCFDLAFYNSASLEGAVLLRGALTFGEVRELDPLFPETGKANVVGEAVVRAVVLEKSGPKGPRLLVSDELAARLDTWLLDRPDGGPSELLWLLPPEGDPVNPEMIGDVARSAVELFLRHSTGGAAAHYAAYLDLVARSLLRLRARERERAALAIERSGIRRASPALERLARGKSPEVATLKRIGALVRESRPAAPRRGGP